MTAAREMREEGAGLGGDREPRALAPVPAARAAIALVACLLASAAGGCVSGAVPTMPCQTSANCPEGYSCVCDGACGTAGGTCRPTPVLPGSPGNVTAVAGNGQAAVSWSPPGFDGHSPILSYAVTASPSGIAVNAGGTSTVVYGLANGTAYTFTVAAVNAIGKGPASAPSAQVVPKAPAGTPGAPTNVRAVAGDGKATVSWSPPTLVGSSAISGYLVLGSTSSGDGSAPGASASSSPAVVTGLVNGTQYAFRVFAINDAGTSAAGGPSNTVTPAAAAPTGLTYSTNPATYTQGVAIAPNTPSSGGGAVVSYTIAPALPPGLALDAATGVITGTPTAPASSAPHTVTATNTGGSATVNLVIGVNPAAPSNLAYALPTAVYTQGVAILPNSPTSTGGAVSSYSVNPALPAGLSLNTATGVISGTPLAVVSAATYTVTATNATGSAQAVLSIAVSAPPAPAALTYTTSAATYTVGTAIPPNSPTSTGGPVISYSVLPALPPGLACSTSTGVISGTPTAPAATASYTVTASNGGGSTQASLTITVVVAAPKTLAYSAPTAVYTVGVAIADNVPTTTGGAPTSWAVDPALPAGLACSTSTGVISGTPTAVAATSTYAVTASNSTGSAQATLTLSVNPAAPAGLSYSSPSPVYVLGVPIAPNSPTSTGGAVASYSVAPPLPAGLALDPANGVVSGTPTVLVSSATSTVTATNVSGSTSALLTITVALPPPANLAYSTNPAVYTQGVAIAPNSPTSTGGPAAFYIVNPELPAGLFLNNGSGVISRMPLEATATTTYTVTASNGGGSTQTGLVLTVNPVAPTSLTYTLNSAVYVKGAPISANRPTTTGGAATSFTVTPSLPVGLALNPTTGVISGSTTAVSGPSTYTVTAANAAGSVQANLSISVLASAPAGLAYSSRTAFYTLDIAIPPNAPSSTGANTSYGVSPALPAGLALDPVSGVIAGTPAALAGPADYTVTATSASSTPVGAIVTIGVVAPPSITSFSAGTNSVTAGAGMQLTAVFADGTGAVSPGIVAAGSLGISSGVPLSVFPTVFNPTYTLTVTNAAGQSVTSSVALTVTSAFSESWEGGWGKWYADNGVWDVGAPTNPAGPGAAYNGRNSASSGLAQNEVTNRVTSLVSPAFSVPAAEANPRLRFWHWFSLYRDQWGGTIGYAQVQAKVVGQSTWTTISPTYRGYGGPWARAFIDLSQYAGQTIQVAFYVYTGAGGWPGWSLDDVAIETGALSPHFPQGWEIGWSSWYADNGLWSPGVPTNPSGPGAAYSGLSCMSTGLAQSEAAGRVTSLIGPAFVVPAATLSPRLRFWHWFSLNRNQWGDNVGWANVQVRVVGETTWTPVTINYQGSGGPWARPLVDLSPYGGKTIQLAFQAYTGGGGAPGWFIDELTIETD